MTCVVGLKTECSIIMGADSAGTNNVGKLETRHDEKVFFRGPFLIGVSGSFRGGNLLRYALKVPEREPNRDVYEYMVNVFVEAVRTLFHDRGQSQTDKNRDSNNGAFLVGYEGRLFTIQSDFQVAELFQDYAAVGSGSDLAFGAMFATEDLAVEPRERVKKALLAASTFAWGVRGPFRFAEQRREPLNESRAA